MKLSKVITTSTLAAAMMLGSVSAMAGDTQSCADLGNKYLNKVKNNVAQAGGGYGSQLAYVDCRRDVGVKKVKMQNDKDCKTKMRFNIWATTSAQQSKINKFYNDGKKECEKLK